jgi:hypothetical protein
MHLRDRKEIEIQPAVTDLGGTVDLAHAGRLRPHGLSTGQFYTAQVSAKGLMAASVYIGIQPVDGPRMAAAVVNRDR